MDLSLLAALVGAGAAAFIGGSGYLIKTSLTAFARLRTSVVTLQQALDAQKEINQELRLAAELQKQVADAVKRAIGGPGV
jgi:hypothetical protein